MPQRRAEIAGAGLAGLAAAIALAQRGWHVHIHERGPELREIGAGIYLWENAIRVLGALGVLDEVASLAHHATIFEIRDERQRLLRRREFGQGNRLLTARRGDLHRALVRRAHEADVQTFVNSAARGATERGALRLDDGTDHHGDLVIAADGADSTVRRSLSVQTRSQRLPAGSIRLLIPRSRQERESPEGQIITEYWSGFRRLLYTPCSRDEIYLGLGTRASDSAGLRVPIDKQAWAASFPALREILWRIEDQGRWDQFREVKVSSWSQGQVALVGDAAHAQPPHLGQGACLAMANALALAVALDERAEVESGLRLWEHRERPLTDHTQRWSRMYGRVSTSRLPGMRWARSTLVPAIERLEIVENQLARPLRQVPTGTI